MCAAQDKFDEFLGRMKLLSLGVLRNNLPYCCSAFYAYDPQNKELIIASASDSEHIKAINARNLSGGFRFKSFFRLEILKFTLNLT